MGDICYAPLIDDMTWSYSRVRSFEDCPYKWYLRYICGLPGKQMFFASYGTFLHKLLASFHSGEASADTLTDVYLRDFRQEVRGNAPGAKVFTSYFQSGLAAVQNMEHFPLHTLGVEQKVEFSVGGYPFVGYIDYLGEDHGGIALIDHKSRALKHRSFRDKPTHSDIELDEYLRQLYVYSIAVEALYGARPTSLCFNCFRTHTLIWEPFLDQAFAASQEWLLSRIQAIRNASGFPPSMEFFKCNYLCEMQDHCEYYGMMRR